MDQLYPGLSTMNLLNSKVQMKIEDKTALQECLDFWNEKHKNSGFDECFAGCVLGEGLIWSADSAGFIFKKLKKLADKI